jgi:hypothetical protein
MAITLSNRGAITARPMMAVRNMAVAAGTSTDMAPPIVTENKHRRRRPASGDGSGTGITGFASASEHKVTTPPAASRRPGPSRNGPACFVVRDHNGQALAYVYFEDEPGRRSAAKLLTRDGATGSKDSCRRAKPSRPGDIAAPKIINCQTAKGPFAVAE